MVMATPKLSNLNKAKHAFTIVAYLRNIDKKKSIHIWRMRWWYTYKGPDFCSYFFTTYLLFLGIGTFTQIRPNVLFYIVALTMPISLIHYSSA
jgi:hypothetical protein